jgi:predicted regulator of Ras-like GTPase activity (Roadblock/LC7/MglB family)
MLSETLETISQRVHGASAVMVVGLDGLVVDQYLSAENDLVLEVVAAEVATLLRQAETSSSDMNTGILEEINMKTDRYYLLIHRITSDYFICMALAVGENLGRARFEMKKARSRLLEEFLI